MIKTFCNRCNKEILPNGIMGIFMGKAIEPTTQLAPDKRVVKSLKETDIHLCSYCYEQLKEHIYAKDEDNNQEATESSK